MLFREEKLVPSIINPTQQTLEALKSPPEYLKVGIFREEEVPTSMLLTITALEHMFEKKGRGHSRDGLEIKIIIPDHQIIYFLEKDFGYIYQIKYNVAVGKSLCLKRLYIPIDISLPP